MMDEKKLEQEYRNLKRQAAPDLWDRIEGNLKEHPEREKKPSADKEEKKEGPKENPKENPKQNPKQNRVVRLEERRQRTGANARPETKKRRTVYGMAAAAAAILVLVSARPVMNQRLKDMPEMEETAAMQMEAAAGGAEGGTDSGTALDEQTAGAAPGPETAAAAEEEKTGAAGAKAGAEAGPGAAAETEAAPGGAVNPAADGQSSDRQSSGSIAEESAGTAALRAQAAAPEALTVSPAVYRLEVPADALTISEDARYFSESILGDTELMCSATVVSAKLEQDSSGRAVKVSYEMTVEQVEYAQDYIAPMDTITVKSPIISTEGDEAYVLYQLMPGNTYLLPLVQRAGSYELLYPFAPQIQVTGEEAYVFHSGYASLISSDASVIPKEQEGSNDYYYDRMLIRTDDNFLSDLIALIQREAQGRK